MSKYGATAKSFEPKARSTSSSKRSCNVCLEFGWGTVIATKINRTACTPACEYAYLLDGVAYSEKFCSPVDDGLVADAVK